MPFQKILALFVIGHISITTPLIEKCKKFNVSLIVVKPNLRPVFYWNDNAEANYLLRQKQFQKSKDDIDIARFLISNKIRNQIKLLKNTRRKDPLTTKSIHLCSEVLKGISEVNDYHILMGLEGTASKSFFSAYFQDLNWIARRPRTKCDPINLTLDIGYTILFNFIECFLRMFGFDLYVGVFHQLWFKRKSLVCDIMEPFRCIIDRTIRNAFHRKQFSTNDFNFQKGEYQLKKDCASDYYRIIVESIIAFKLDIFRFIQSYYRSFMRGTTINQSCQFKI